VTGMDTTRRKLLIGIVGPCGAGKSSLVERLSPYYSCVRAIAQEHSYVPTMWQRLTNPDVLIYLDASYPVTVQRRKLNWTEAEYQIELERLAHARQHADITIQTDDLDLDSVARTAAGELERLLAARNLP
jgi:deoxyadenosine/deoxycytidine kinase